MTFSYRHFPVIDSTNDYLKSNYRELNDFTLVQADYQTAGRGQFLRGWESLPRQNILASILIKSELSDEVVHQYEKKVLEGLVSLLQEYQIDSYIKRPNDIYVKNKKISGILIETKQTSGVYDYLVIGIGLNVLQETFKTEIKATSIRNEYRGKLVLDEVSAQLQKRLAELFVR